MKKKMFYGAIPFAFERARALRLETTPAETRLWNYLRTKPFEIKFRRQHPIGPFIADFYAHKLKLVIDVDGDVHTDPEVAKWDVERQGMLETDGITVVRFTNDAVLTNFEKVQAGIEHAIDERLKAETPSNNP